eukprot:g53898.t1
MVVQSWNPFEGRKNPQADDASGDYTACKCGGWVMKGGVCNWCKPRSRVGGLVLGADGRRACQTVWGPGEGRN